MKTLGVMFLGYALGTLPFVHEKGSLIGFAMAAILGVLLLFMGIHQNKKEDEK